MVKNTLPPFEAKTETKNSAPTLILKSWAMVNKPANSIHQKAYDILAVAVGCSFTLVWGNLHKALLTGATYGGWVAAAFLHRERREYDRRD